MIKLRIFIMGAIAFLCFETSAVAERKNTYLCEKAKLFSGKITVRSFRGVLCRKKDIARWAESNCRGIDRYEKSRCHKNALKVLRNEPKKGISMEEIIAGLKKDKVSGNINKKERSFLEAFTKNTDPAN